MDAKTFLPELLKIIPSLPEEEVISLLNHLRENISSSSKMMLGAYLLMVPILASNILLSNGRTANVNIMGILINDTTEAICMTLIFSALLFALSICSEFAWRWYRELYDYIYTIKSSPLSKSGIHDFRVPTSYSGAVTLVMQHGPLTSRVAGHAFQALAVCLFVSGPITVILIQAATLMSRSLPDFTTLGFATGLISALLALLSLPVLYGSNQIARLDVLLKNSQPKK